VPQVCRGEPLIVHVAPAAVNSGSFACPVTRRVAESGTVTQVNPLESAS